MKVIYINPFITMPRQCKNHPNNFCYVCGLFATKSRLRTITKDLRKTYKLYFGCPLGDQDKAWTPHVICSGCSNGLRDWLNQRKTSMPFAIPMIWREPRDHHSDCYFCNVNITGFSVKNKHKIAYPNVDSVTRPIPHNEMLLVPVPPQHGLDSLEDEMESDEGAIGRDPRLSADLHYTPDKEKSEPKIFTQDEFNDLIRDLALSKKKAELLASRLKQKHLLEKNIITSVPQN